MATYLSDEERDYYERTRRPILRIPQSRVGRVIFGIFVVLWFMILLLPCALFSLAFGGEIRIWHGDIPEREAHPLLLVNLVMDVDNRGLQFTRSTLHDASDTAVCIQTNVNYITWATDGSAQAAVYCDCYARADQDAAWQLAETRTDACDVSE